MNNTITYKLDEELYKHVVEYYREYQVPNNNNYIIFCAKCLRTTITIYQSVKGKLTAVFSGQNPKEEANNCFTGFDIMPENIAKRKEKYKLLNKGWLDEELQIGSDEVGVGDLVLPMIVVAAFVTREDMYYLASKGIKDSKKMTDEYILSIGDEVVFRFKDCFSKVTLSNDKYNEMIKKGENLNSLKARMHNQVLFNMHKKYRHVDHFYVDKFVNEKKYFEYLAKDKEIIDNIIFMEKGETYYPSVALASFIARYSLLLVQQKLSEKYDVKFPFGAGIDADKFADKFVEEFGVYEFKKIAKLNFRNSRDILEKYGDVEDDDF